MIDAYIVAKDFEDDVIRMKNVIAKRTFTKGRRPPMTLKWSNLKLIKYKYNPKTAKLEFEEVK
ncbi:hypothetical protein MTP04_04380 [Lysinibacillus sp. PLM2]|nr:hypothetical protein MTP04_04380 [Lysinibacillus sp. PLM2]